MTGFIDETTGLLRRTPDALRTLTPALLLGICAAGVIASSTTGLTCGRTPDDLEVAITSGWPQASPADHVVIATITDILPERGDAFTWGERLTVQIDAVLRGDLPLMTLEIFNPPLGAAGWPDFRVGGQFLIVAHPDTSNGGRLSTWLCPPNEEISSIERFNHLVAMAASPRISNTAMPPPPAPIVLFQATGLVLIGLAVSLVVRGRMGRR